MLRGAYDILAVCQEQLGGIKPGQTTKDGKFTLIEVECQGACSNAPMLVVGDDFYEDLTEETTKKILAAFAKGEKPKPGPQSGRFTSENSAGLTSLTGKVCLQSLPFLQGTEGAAAVWTRRVQHTRVRVNRYLLMLDVIRPSSLSFQLRKHNNIINQSSPSPSSKPYMPSPPSGRRSIR
jgi:(2Fe-2S) ferredoxin